MKDHLLFAFLLLLVPRLAAAGSLFEATIPITTETQTLLVVNAGDTKGTFWISRPLKPDEELAETSFDIPAHTKLEVPLGPWDDSPWIRVLALSPTVSPTVTLQLRLEGQAFVPWPWGSSNVLAIQRGLPHAVIWLSNLTGEKQNFVIVGADNGAEYLRGPLEPYQTKKLTWRGTAGALQIKADLRISALLDDVLTKKSQAFLPIVSDFSSEILPPSSPEEARFVLANSANDQSFVIAITDPTLITLARRQINEPTVFQPRMLVARVARGPAHLNYDGRGALQAPWSWHIEQIYRFADFGSIDCDGSPQLMEQTLEWWLPARNGLICFWDYKIKSELKPQ